MAFLAFAMTVEKADAAFGEHFGIAPINDGAGPAPEVPAMPNEHHAFWAGTCDRGAAPSPGGDLSGLGGIGSLPATVQAAPGDAPNTIAPQVAAPSVPGSCIDWGDLPTVKVPDLWTTAPGWRLPAVDDAGSHPDGTATFWSNRETTVPPYEPDGSLDNIYVDLPAGFVGDPNAVPKCTADQFAVRPLLCPPETQVGVLRIYLLGASGLQAGDYAAAGNNEQIVPVFNLEPREGKVAELGMGYLGSSSGPQGTGFVTARIVAKARTNGDFGVTSFVGQIPAVLPVYSQAITIWGIPWEKANDVWRTPLGIYDNPLHPCAVQPGADLDNLAGRVPYSGLSPACRESYDPSWGPIRPFISVETDCNPAPATGLAIDQYARPGAFTPEGDPDFSDADWKRYESVSPPVIDCGSLDFDPDIEFGPTSSSADGASGLTVDLAVSQKTAPPFAKPGVSATVAAVDGYVENSTGYWKSDAGRATAHLKDSVVSLPAGVSLNPSAATGLVSCPDSVIGVRQLGNPPLFNNVDPADGVGGDDCPDGSRLGTARVQTHLLEEPLLGEVILGEPKSTDPQSGEMFRLFIVLRSKARGLVAKVYGSAKADPITGRIVATFENNPELPFEDLELDFKSGAKGVLAMPQRCGSASWTSAFTPWSSVGAATPVADTVDGGSFAVDANCGFGFDPSLDAGMDVQQARANGALLFELARSEGQQQLGGLTARLPKGLLASVRDIPLCSNAQAAAGACPAGSKIGIIDASAGSGDPFVLEEKGELFLTEGYKGGEYGLLVKVRGVAGPFHGARELSPILVRQAIHVDPTTAEVTAVSDPFPTIHHGVPLRVRRVMVLVNRAGFMLNPSGCAAKQIGATIVSTDDARAERTLPFKASRCGELAFKPSLGLRMTGRKQVKTGKHPGIRAVVTQQGVPEAGIERAEVRLPKSLALDVDNAQALCEFADGTSANPEDRCPKGSIVGRARAVSPLLNDPLVGNVYFVKNVRRSATGNLIRTLPMIIVALRGEIAVNLKGESDVKRGKLVNTFAAVPDAPVSRFNLNIKGGRNGILAVTRTRRGLINLCAKPKSHVAEADMDGHNGLRYDRDVRMKTPCTKKQRKAQRAAAKRRTDRGATAKRR